MSKSVKELAEQLHISKQAVYQRINSIKDFRNKYTKRSGNRLEISDSGVNVLLNYVKNSQQDFKEPLDEMYAMLIEQLKEKDKQIENKDEQIINLQQSLRDEQKLSLNAVSEVKHLRSRMKRLNIDPDNDDSIEVSEFKESSSASDETNDSASNQTIKSKQPFWKFWKKS